VAGGIHTAEKKEGKVHKPNKHERKEGKKKRGLWLGDEHVFVAGAASFVLCDVMCSAVG
jgi:hypothetical protein